VKEELRAYSIQLRLDFEEETRNLREVLRQHEEEASDTRQKDLADIRAKIEAVHAHSEQRANMAMQSLGELNLCFSTMLQATQAQEMADREFLNKRIDVACAEAAASLAVKWNSSAILLREQGDRFDAEIKNVRCTIDQLSQEQRASVDAAVRMSLENHTGHVASFQEHLGAFKEHLAFTKRLEDDLAQHASDANKRAAEMSDALALHSTSLGELRKWSNDELRRIDDHVGRLSIDVAEVHSFMTRRIDWVIPGAASSLVAPPGAPRRCQWRSPPFNAAGLRGLQFEFSITQDGNEDLCELVLRGQHPGFYLYGVLNIIGAAGSSAVSATAQHTFIVGALDCNVVKLKMHELMALVNANAGELHVTFEIIEATRFVEAATAGGDGELTRQRYVHFQTLANMLANEERINKTLASCAKTVQTGDQLSNHKKRIDLNAAEIAKARSELGALPGLIEEFNQRWEDFRAEVKTFKIRQEERLLEAIQKESKLLTLAEAMQRDLTTSLALKGRSGAQMGPPVPKTARPSSRHGARPHTPLA